jgi:hypothetical protein
MDVFSIATGAAGAGIAYFLYLVSSKGLPAALAWVKARWNAGKADLEQLKGDVDIAKRDIAAFDSKARSSFAAVYAELDEIKARLGLPTAAAQAPDSKAAPAAEPQPPAFLQGQS